MAGDARNKNNSVREEFEKALAMAERIRHESQPAPPAGHDGGVSRHTKKRRSFGFQSLDDEHTLESVKIRHKLITISLRKTVARAAIFFVALQIICANWFFGKYMYAVADSPESLNPTVMVAWLSSSVVEIIGILGIVAISLFPNKSRSKSKRTGESV